MAVDTRVAALLRPRNGAWYLRRNRQRKETHDPHTHRGRRCSCRSDRVARHRACRRPHELARGRAHQNLAVSGSITFDGIWTATSGQKQFQDVINAFNKTYPNVHVNYKPVGDSLPTVLATAVAGGNPPDMADIAQPGTVAQFAKQGKLKPITYAKSIDRPELRAGVAAARHVQRQAVRARFQGGQQVGRLVQRPRLQGGRREAAEDVLAASHRREDDQGVAALRRTRSAAPTVGRSPTCSRTSTCARSARRSTTPSRAAQDQVDRSVGEDGADDDGEDHRRHVERRRRDERSAPVRVQRLRHERVRLAAEGGDGVRGRLRRRRHLVVDEGEGEDRLQHLHLAGDHPGRGRGRRSRSAATCSSRSATPRRSRRS